MKLEEAKEILERKLSRVQIKVGAFYPNALLEYKDLEALETVLQELERLQKENEKLKQIDLTTVHIKGVCDEKERWRNKIREKIKEIYEDKFNKYYDMFLEKRDIEKTISILKDLQKEE